MRPDKGSKPPELPHGVNEKWEQVRVTAVTKKGLKFPVNTEQFSVTVRADLLRGCPCPGPITLWAGIVFGLKDSAK